MNYRLPLGYLKQYLYSISCDTKYRPTVQEEARLVELLRTVPVPATQPLTAQMVEHFCNPLYRHNRNWHVWYGIRIAVKNLLVHGEE